MKSPEMQPLLKFLESMLHETDHAMRRAKGDDVPQLQGRAQVLEDFLTAVEKSPGTLEKFNQKQT